MIRKLTKISKFAQAQNDKHNLTCKFDQINKFNVPVMSKKFFVE